MRTLCLGLALVDLICEQPVAGLAAALGDAVEAGARSTERWGALR